MHRKVDADLTEVIQDLGLELEAMLRRMDVALPPGVTGQTFMRELLEGGPGITPDPSFFARVGVSLKLAGLRDQQNITEIIHHIRARLAARRAATEGM